MQKYCLPFGWVSSITTTSTWNFSDKFLDARRVDLAGRTQKSDDFWFHGCTYLFETFDSTDPASMPPMSQMALEKQLFAVVQVWSALTCQRIQRDPKRGNLASRLDSEMQSGLDISDMFLRNSRSRYDSFNQFWYSILFGDLRNPPFGCDRGTQVHTVGTESICTSTSYYLLWLCASIGRTINFPSLHSCGCILSGPAVCITLHWTYNRCGKRRDPTADSHWDCGAKQICPKQPNPVLAQCPLITILC